jgi:ABC-type glycerol-3-phosphate transport system substrate-binding protein
MQIPEFLLNRRNQIIIAVVLVIVIIITTVSLTQAKPKPKVVKKDPVTLSWWKPFYGKDAYSKIIDDFKKIPGNENISIDIVTKKYDDTYYSSLLSDMARNAGPDIFSIRNDDLPAYEEFMTPLTNIVGSELSEYKQNFVDLVVKETIDRDKVYAVTSYVDNLQLYYNKNMLAQSGIALPPSTWSDLDRQLPLLNKRSLNSSQFTQSAISLGVGGRASEGISNINRHEDILPLLIFQNGGQVYDNQSKKVTFGLAKNKQDLDLNIVTGTNFKLDENDKQQNPTYRAIKFYTDFADQSSSRYSWNTSLDYNTDAFIKGKLAYILHYSYFSDEVKLSNERLPFSVAPLPQLDTSIKKTYGFYFMDGINRALETNAPKKAAAEKFLKYLTTKEAQQEFAEKTKLPGARKETINQQINSDDTIRLFAAGALYADNYYKPNVVATEKIWSDLVERIQYTGQPLSESINQAINQYTTLVQKGPTLRR